MEGVFSPHISLFSTEGMNSEMMKLAVNKKVSSQSQDTSNVMMIQRVTER